MMAERFAALCPADETRAKTPCPDWCDEDIPSHISKDRIVVAEVAPERTEIFIGLEQEDVPGASAVLRIQGAADALMTPAQALELAAQITYAAHRALFA